MENLLSEHPAISEVAVVAGPDATTGERGCAFVVTHHAQDLTLEDVHEFLTGREVAKQKIPESVFVVDVLPKTASGKIQKFALRDWTVTAPTSRRRWSASAFMRRMRSENT